MAGIGPIDTNRQNLLKRAGFRGRTEPANELEIFCSLCVGRVIIRDRDNRLYFVDSPALSISDIIRQVFKGIGQQPRINQLYMDVHQLLRASSCIALTPRQRTLLVAAFALNGIHIQII